VKATLDESIRSALAAIVAESPELGPVPTAGYVQLRRTEQPRRTHRRIVLVAATLCAAAALGVIALVVWRDTGDESVPAQTPSVAHDSTEPEATDPSLGYLSIPTMDGGAFVVDGHSLTVGIAVHDPATALPQDTANRVSVINVGREQFGALENLTIGAEIFWQPTGASAEIRFTVTSVHSFTLDTDPATITRNGLIVVTDAANPKSSQQIVITAIQVTNPTTTDSVAS
jgi:hypothetical protein